MIVRRSRVLLLNQQLVERGLLFRRWLEEQRHALHLQSRRGRPLIELRASERMQRSLQSHHAAIVNRANDAVLLGCLSEGK